MNNKKCTKLGFTLAEVLITLVIIGIIAAMTIPTLINKTQDQEMKSQFAKAYSTLSQAIYKTNMMDFGGAASCYYPYDLSTNSWESPGVRDECPAFYDALSKNLQVQKICKGNAKDGGCVPVYQTYNTASGCNGFSQNHIDNIDYAYVLSNGQIIITYSNAGYATFLIDINGQKGPNAYGKDLFNFLIFKHDDSGLFINRGSCEFKVSGGRTTAEMIKYSVGGERNN